MTNTPHIPGGFADEISVMRVFVAALLCWIACPTPYHR